MEKTKIEVTAAYNKPPINEQKREFKVDKADMSNLHKFLLELRRSNPEADKVQLFTEDDVVWKDIAMVLDAVKVRGPNDPVIVPPGASELDKRLAAEFLYPKVVMASVMLR
jgi:hypothetical protein